IQYRKVAYGISIVVLLLGVASVFHGFDYGVEFSGGRSFIVNFGKPVDQQQLNDALFKTFNKNPVIKTYGSANVYDITTDYRINEQGLGVDSAVRNLLFTGLKPFLPATATLTEFNATTTWVQGTKKVDPTISDDLKTGAQWATFWSMLI